MKKIKSPWYGAVWIAVWTAALIWFLTSGMFSTRESVGLVIVWAIMSGITGYLIVWRLKADRVRRRLPQPVPAAAPARNAACPCGSGKKFKRCCGQENS
jgi:hypothetical protein